MLRDIQTKEYKACPLERKRGGYTFSVDGRPVDAYEWAKAEYKRVFGAEPVLHQKSPTFLPDSGRVTVYLREQPAVWGVGGMTAMMEAGRLVQDIAKELDIFPPRLRWFDRQTADPDSDAGWKMVMTTRGRFDALFLANTNEVWVDTHVARDPSGLKTMLAHELRHAWQWKHARDRYGDKDFIEADAERYASDWVRRQAAGNY